MTGVLHALDRYYDRMAARNEAEAPGYWRRKISFAIVLSTEGDPLDILELRRHAGKRLVPRLMEVPASEERSVNILPKLLWDNTAYVLGRTAGKDHRTAQEHASFKEAHLALLEGADDDGLVALRRFLETWLPARFDAA